MTPPRKNRHAPHRKGSAPHSHRPFPLLHVPAEPIRKKALTACRRAKTAFEKAEAGLIRHEREEVPAHEAWMRMNHGELLDEIKALEEAHQQLEWRIGLVCYACEELDMEGAEAAQWVEDQEKERESRGNPREDWEDRQRRTEEVFREIAESFLNYLKELRREIRIQLRKGMPPEILRQNLSLYFTRHSGFPPEFASAFFYREDTESIWKEFGLGVGTADEAALAPQEPRSARIKRLARELAFALHPDQSGKADPRKLELWHQVQEAVKLGDLDRLEVLHAHMQVLQGDTGPSLSVGRIQDLTQEFRESLKALRRRLRVFRASDAWGFLSLHPHEKEEKAKKTGEELRRRRTALQQQTRQLQRQLREISSWRRADTSGDWEEDDILGLFGTLFGFSR